jgi:hypothetical protein
MLILPVGSPGARLAIFWFMPDLLAGRIFTGAELVLRLEALVLWLRQAIDWMIWPRVGSLRNPAAA